MKHGTRVSNVFFFTCFMDVCILIHEYEIRKSIIAMFINYLDKIGNEIKYNEIRCEQNKKCRQMCANQILKFHFAHFEYIVTRIQCFYFYLRKKVLRIDIKLVNF